MTFFRVKVRTFTDEQKRCWKNNAFYLPVCCTMLDLQNRWFVLMKTWLHSMKIFLLSKRKQHSRFLSSKFLCLLSVLPHLAPPSERRTQFVPDLKVSSLTNCAGKPRVLFVMKVLM